MMRMLVTILVFTSAFAQKTILTQPMGSDTFRLKADMCLWTRGWYQMNTDSLSNQTTEFTFGRAFGFVGVTAQFTRHGYVRYYYDQGDISGKPAYDLFAGVTCHGVEMRFGQLKLPLGYEVISAPWRTDFVDYSRLASCRTPTGATRDLGALLLYNHRLVQPALGIVNGQGRNVEKDRNSFVDFAGRLAFTPLGEPSLTIGVSGYLGNDTLARKGHARPFSRLGAEAAWMRPDYFVRGEFLMGADSTGIDSTGAATGYRRLNGLYFASGLRVGHFQPVLRVERFSLDGKLTSTLAFGLNAFLCQDMLKPMLGVSMSRDEATLSEVTRVSLQLQGAFW